MARIKSKKRPELRMVGGKDLPAPHAPPPVTDPALIAMVASISALAATQANQSWPSDLIALVNQARRVEDLLKFFGVGR